MLFAFSSQYIYGGFMEQVNVITQQIIILSIVGLVGYFAGVYKRLPDNSSMVISKLVVNITAPLLVFTTLSRYKFSSQLMKDGLLILLLAFVFILMGLGIGSLVLKLLKLDDKKQTIFKMYSMFGNVVFLGFPLLDSVYPGKGLIYAFFFSLANETLLWTVGMYIMNRKRETSFRQGMKNLFNTNTISFLAGIAVMVLNIDGLLSKNDQIYWAYNILIDSLNSVGKTTIYLSMLFIGLILSDIKLNSLAEILKRVPLLILVFIKLLVIPFIALGIMSIFKGIDPFIKAIVFLQIAMPCGTVVAALSAQYQADYKFACECVFVSTVLSVATLPILVYVLQML